MEEIISQLAQDDSFVGATRNLLEKYLQEKEGASEDYPNGTYLYIYENHVLTTEQITEETAFVEALLLKAISEGYTKDSDITSLLKNANFTEGFDGWEGVMPNNVQDGVVETYNDPFDMHQTLTGLANGVYELQVTGLFRPTGDAENTNYAAMIYANGLKTYLPAEIENDANPSVILANITDGTLTIGIKNEGTGCSGDYTKFSNIKLTIAEPSKMPQRAWTTLWRDASTVPAPSCPTNIGMMAILPRDPTSHRHCASICKRLATR